MKILSYLFYEWNWNPRQCAEIDEWGFLLCADGIAFLFPICLPELKS
jgi:hypothetical protein